MKKSLLALAVMTAAGSAHAFEIYSNDGVTVGLHGDVEVVYTNETTRSSFQQEIQDADFGFDVRYAINEEYSFGGYWEFDGSKHTNAEDTANGDTYVALYSQSVGSIKFGRLCTALDDAGIGSDFQFGINSFLDNEASPCADEAVRYDIDTGSFYGTIGLVQNKVDSAGDSTGNDDAYYDLKAGYRVADFDFTAYYGDVDIEATKYSETLLGLEGKYAGIENVGLAIAYYSDDKETAGVSSKGSNVALNAEYSMDLWTFAGGYSFASHDDKAKEIDMWYVNAGYAIAPSTTTYVELGGEDYADGTDTDVALAIGVKASF